MSCESFQPIPETWLSTTNPFGEECEYVVLAKALAPTREEAFARMNADMGAEYDFRGNEYTHRGLRSGWIHYGIVAEDIPGEYEAGEHYAFFTYNPRPNPHAVPCWVLNTMDYEESDGS